MQVLLISIHAAREGGDCVGYDCICVLLLISIHAAREGGDAIVSMHSNNLFYFNPRRP